MPNQKELDRPPINQPSCDDCGHAKGDHLYNNSVCWIGGCSCSNFVRQSKTPEPHCSYCGDPAPYGDERNHWIGPHTSLWHRLYWVIKKELRK